MGRRREEKRREREEEERGRRAREKAREKKRSQGMRADWRAEGAWGGLPDWGFISKQLGLTI